MDFDRFTLVLLLRPDDPPALDDAAADELQDRHLAFGADLYEQGKMIAAGPLVSDDDDRPWRGISVYAVEPEQAAALVAEDPAVQAGRLAPVVLTWMVPAGIVHFDQGHLPRSIAEARS
jgi:uncharacterized protein YciI